MLNRNNDTDVVEIKPGFAMQHRYFSFGEGVGG